LPTAEHVKVGGSFRLPKFAYPHFRWIAFGLEAIRAFAAENTSRHCVIDVGAGFQDARSAKHLNKIHHTIALTGEPRVIYQRKIDHRGDDRNFAAYSAKEFSEHRRAVYNACSHIIDTTHQMKQGTAAALKSVIDSILGVGKNAG
jgi:shikimate kinase